jgi:hypothetical protein
MASMVTPQTGNSSTPPANSKVKRKRSLKKADDEIEDDKTWTSGDFEVVTVDRVRFRVPSYLLFGSR